MQDPKEDQMVKGINGGGVGMKVGDKVKLKVKDRAVIGKVLGCVNRYGVDWILVEWNKLGHAIVLETALEVLNESR